MEILRNGVHWQRWVSFLLLACAVFAYRKLDNPGYTREFISKIDHDCRDFKGVMNKCHVWKDLGFCFKYRREMQHVCNRTCQYCVPGQKQWQVIDRAWGRVKEPVSQSVSAPTSAPAVEHKGPAIHSIQILGKERAPQVDDAASAIATQLENGVDHDVSASPNVLGRLPEHHTGFQNTLAPTYTKNATENDKTKDKLLTSRPVSEIDHDQRAQTITNQASISGKTQVRESSKEGRPVVVLMGYELGEKSSKRVHEVLKNSDSKWVSDPRSGETVGPNRAYANDKLASRGNRTFDVNTIPGHASIKNIEPENIVPDSELKEIAELLDNAASARRHYLHDKQYTHKGKKDHSASENTLHSKLHAAALHEQSMGAFRNNTTQKEKIRSQAEAILPVSSDDVINQQAFQRMKSISHFRYKNNDMHDKTDPSIVNASLKRISSEGMQLIDLSRTMAGNQYQSFNDPSLQMNPPLRKPVLSGSHGNQLTLTVNAKPGTGEAIFKVQTSPRASGIRYTTEKPPEGFPSPDDILENENEEDRAKSEEEETKIREATQAIKNVMKLFGSGNRHDHTKLVTKEAQDFPAHSKSLETNREMAGIQSEIDAQAQSQELAAARAQALSQQIGEELSPNKLGVSSIPNYAVISTKDSKDWKNLAHMLATQLKSVLNHMEDREKENQYQKEKIEEEMMMMARQRQMMGGDDDEDPYDDDNDDDGEMSDREKRRHSVLNPHLKKSSENRSKNISSKDESLRRLNSGNITEQKLLHRAVKKLSQLEMLHKSQGQLIVQT